MKKYGKKILICASCVLLAALIIGGSIILHVSGNTRYFSGAAEEYYQSLLDAGFPEDYAVSLTELHLLHPTWEFEALMITEGKASYTWSYIIDQETKEEDNNLISSADSQKPYRHPTNTTQFDNGDYQASREAVEYFMDPRNFLNETDIFQFYDLSAGADPSEDAVRAVLAGTFMENALLENGMDYASYFLQVGEELSVDPLYLAVKARQEQGVVGSSPVISGNCGTLLNDYYTSGSTEAGAPSSGYTSEELLALNGLYNFYNNGAYGNGRFTIYYNAMQRAKKGTAHMSEAWGGSPAWNTLWKSIWGGAYSIKASYIDRYQNTIYLQKFNVDSRSDRNFWGQYMQNVGGALTEARILYSSFASIGALDADCTFLIPVYDGMPNDPCADPADGSCSYLATADRKYDYTVTLTSPISKGSDSAALYFSQEMPSGGILELDGQLSHSYGLLGLEYAWDGGEWIECSIDENLQLSLPVDFSEGSSHILVIRGRAAYDHHNSAKKSNAYVLAAVIYVDVTTPPKALLRLENGDSNSELILPLGTKFRLPEDESTSFIGWHGSDNTLLPGGSEAILRQDITYRALYLQTTALDGAALTCSDGTVQLRFSLAVKEELARALKALPTPATFTALLHSPSGDSPIPLQERNTLEACGATWNRLTADTGALLPEDWETTYQVTYTLTLTYSDGSDGRFSIQSDKRSAFDVAKAADLDPLADHSDLLQDKLDQILHSESR